MSILLSSVMNHFSITITHFARILQALILPTLHRQIKELHLLDTTRYFCSLPSSCSGFWCFNQGGILMVVMESNELFTAGLPICGC